MDKIPISITIYAILLIILIVLFTIFNFKKSNLKKPKSYIGIAILSITCIIPIFWNKVITNETKIFYFVYFSWLLYIVLFFIVGINVNKRSLRFFIFCMSWLAVLISSECIFKILETAREYPEDYSLLSIDYYVGWGLCNEAGLMLCFTMPFIFYEMAKTDHFCISLINIFKIGITVIGIILTSSRGTYLFGTIELVLLIILLIIFSKKRTTYIIFFLITAFSTILFVQFKYGIVELIQEIQEKVFYLGLGDDQRFNLWNSAYSYWNENALTRIFGSGIVSETEIRYSFNGWDKLVFVVYHSTFFEILCSCGIIGIIGILIHFYEKYRQLFKNDKAFLWLFGIGYLVVDLYGMIDNTYGMYYYMIPLILFMAILDNDKNTDIYSNSLSMNYEFDELERNVDVHECEQNEEDLNRYEEKKDKQKTA